MEKKITLIFLFFSLCICARAQVTFQKTYGGTTSEQGYSVLEVSDGGYVIAGSFFTPSSGDYDVYLLRTDAAGNLLWTKTFGGTSEDQGFSMVQATDGGYVIAGSTSSFGSGDYDVFLLKVDSSGNLLWSKTVGNNYDNYAYDVYQTSDGGYVLVGRTGTSSALDNVYLLKTDASGSLLWTKSFAQANLDFWGMSVRQTSTGEFVITGHTYDFNTANVDAYLLKTDSSGNFLWAKTYGGTGDDFGNSVRQTTDGGYIVAGRSSSFGSGSTDIYLLKTDASGNLAWSKILGSLSSDYGMSVSQTTDNGFVIAGIVNDNAYLLRVNAVGNAVWAKSFGGPSYTDHANDVKQTADGGFILAGSTLSFGSGGFDVYLIKTDSLGISGCVTSWFASTSSTTTVTASISLSVSSVGVAGNPATASGSGGTSTSPCFTTDVQSAMSDSQSAITVFPNPTTDELRIDNGELKIKEIEIYSVLGEKVFKSQISPEASGLKSQILVDVSQLPSGLYFLKLLTNNGMTVSRFVKQ